MKMLIKGKYSLRLGMVELHDFHVDELIARFLLAYSGMNGGKTKFLKDVMDRATHAGRNVRGFIHQLQAARDGIDCMRINEVEVVPAKSFGDAADIRKEIERVNALCFSRQPSQRGEKIKDPEHSDVYYYLNRKVELAAIDEFNLSLLAPQNAREMLGLVDELRRDGVGVVAAGLWEDFRGRNFGYIVPAFNKADQTIRWNAVCKMDRGGRLCGDPALHTHKLWRAGTLDEAMSRIMKDSPRVDWYTKKGEAVEGEYVVAPFFAPTVEIEPKDEIPEGKRPFVYVPACNRCWQGNPFEEEVYRLYHAIDDFSVDPRKVLEDPLLTAAILKFLTNELDGWSRELERGRLVNINYRRNELGGVSRAPGTPDNYRASN